MKRALLSVSNKEGLVEFGHGLADLGIEILATGKTAEVLKKAGIPIVEVSEFTGSPEILDGRVKTLHPKVHGAILANRKNPDHMRQVEEQGIGLIDLVVVNLYPFEQVVDREGTTFDEAIENIDIGGPTLIRAAAKNCEFVTVVTHLMDYEAVLNEIREHGNTLAETRKQLARKAFARTYHYDENIEHYFRNQLGMAELLDLHYEKVTSLRYGENPHQKAAFFRNPLNNDANITNAKVLQGKQLSFNNLVDGDAALELVKDFEAPMVALIKHNNPCGAASGETIEEAFELAYNGDPMSAFGSVIALNRECNKWIVDFINEKKLFVEIIIAPSFEPSALELLAKKPNLRLLEVGPLKSDRHRRDVKKVAGGILIQSKDTYRVSEKDFKVVTQIQPTPEQIKSMIFATQIVKHVQSNAIVLAQGTSAVGIGAGQMSRVDAVYLACYKAGEKAKNSVLSSDAFFPFADGIEMAAKYGVSAIAQPGGSMRDDEVIKRADELGLAMVFTGIRFFRH